MLKFVGDICLSDNDFDKGFGVGSKLEKGHNVFSKILKGKNEIWMGNMECVLSESSERTGYNNQCFRVSPKILSFDNLIDCYSVANNHIMEHGLIAYNETIEAITHCGKEYVGSNEKKTIVLTDGDKKIAITSFSLRCDNTGFKTGYWYNPELKELKCECDKYQDNVHLRVAYIHWGVEFVPYPYKEQQVLAHYLVDIGYDLIIGVHPHIIQGFEIYKGKYIYYSIGNFVFNMSYPDTQIGLVVSYDCDKNKVFHEYVKIDSSYSPALITEDKVPYDLRASNRNVLIGKYPNIEQYARASSLFLNKYRKYHHMSIVKNFFKYDIVFFKGMFLTFIKNRFNK